MCKRYRIDNSRRNKHTALIDCELLSKVYVNLLDQKEPTLNFKNINTSSDKKDYYQNLNYNKRIVVPTLEESKLHKSFLKKFVKKNYFS